MSAASAKAWAERNPEKRKAVARKSYEKHRTKRQETSFRNNARRYANHRAAIDKIKIEQGCADCGYREHPAALEFHHVRGDKLFTISSNIMRRWQLTLEEIAKCEVVCANCHRIRHQDSCVTLLRASH